MTTHEYPASRNGLRQDSSEPSLADPPDASVAPALAVLAAQPGVDDCDIAEAAIPELIFGSLDTEDENWIRAHNVTCRSCRSLLESIETLSTCLDTRDSVMCDQLSDKRPSALACLGVSEARYGYMDSPVGDVLVATSDDGVCEVSFVGDRERTDALREIERRGYLVYPGDHAVKPAVEQLQEYFGHERTSFDLPLDLAGVTSFTQQVLAAANSIPYGVVKTYGDIAEAIGRPRASRAVGNALGRNPIPIIVPCHRVIRSSGAMGWYTGGPEIKRALLGIEGVRYAARDAEPARTLPLTL